MTNLKSSLILQNLATRLRQVTTFIDSRAITLCAKVASYNMRYGLALLKSWSVLTMRGSQFFETEKAKGLPGE